MSQFFIYKKKMPIRAIYKPVMEAYKQVEFSGLSHSSLISANPNKLLNHFKRWPIKNHIQ